MSINNRRTGWIRAIFTHGKWYMLSSLLTKGIGIILLPVYTKYLTPEDYGVLNTLTSITRFLPIILSLYLDAAFGRYYHDWKNSPKQLKSLFSSIYWFVILYGAVALGLILFSANFWLEDFFQVKVWPYAYLSFIPALLAQIGQLGIVYLRQSFQSKTTTVVILLSTIINIVVTIPLLVHVDIGIRARLWGGVASSFFLFVFYTVLFIRNGLLGFSFNKSVLKECLKYSTPLIPSILGGWIASMSDRLVIAKFDSLDSVGLYGVGFQFAFVLYLIQDAVTQVQGPLSMDGLINDRENTKDKIAHLSLFILGGMLVAHLGLFLFSKEIITLMADVAFEEAYTIIGIMGFVYVLSSQYRLFATIISYHKKTWVIASAGIIMGVINLLLNLFLVPLYGYIAAAYATVGATLFYTLWIFTWSQFLEPVQLPLVRIISVITIYSFALWIGILLLNKPVGIEPFIMKLGIFLIMFVVTSLIILKRTSYERSY